MKRIKSSKRGLTFSMNDTSSIGKKFRYFIDKSQNQIVIIEDENGAGTVSRKKCGKTYKPLYDLRSKEVRDLVSKAEYLEVEDAGEKIIVHIYQKVTRIESFLKSNILELADILAAKTGEIVIDCAVGEGFPTKLFGRPTLADDDYFRYLSDSQNNVLTRRKQNHNSNTLKKVYDVISLFSGAGMLDYGFRDPQFRFVFANDACLIDGKMKPEIAQTFEYNMGHAMTIGDIRQIHTTDVPPADVIIGGPCCQGYSGIMSRADRRYSDSAESKRLLIDDYVRFVKDKRPKVFVIENVPQFLTEKHGLYIQTHLIEQLPEYEITATVVKDSDVGGYSIRKRAIVIGSRIGKIELPDTKLSVVKTVKDALSKVDPTWPNYLDVSESSEGTKMLMRYVPDGGNWKDIPPDIAVKYRSSHTPFGPKTQSQSYKRLHPDKPSCAIPNWRKLCMMPPTEFGLDRQLSISEVAAIQGLPKEFKFFGSVGAMQQMLGNGVTQAMAKFIKKHVLAKLNDTEKICIFA